jgi:spore maturation protein CgeB
MVIRPYLFPLLEPVGKYKVKIFGNQPWLVNQYCGMISDHKVKDLFVSAKICPNLSEPHAQAYGFDVNERIFKILYAGGFCISDNVEGYKMFGDGVVLADSPSDFAEKIDYYANTDEGTIDRSFIAKTGHRIVKENHTGFHRVAQILKELSYDDLSQKLLSQYREILNNES